MYVLVLTDVILRYSFHFLKTFATKNISEQRIALKSHRKKNKNAYLERNQIYEISNFIKYLQNTNIKLNTLLCDCTIIILYEYLCCFYRKRTDTGKKRRTKKIGLSYILFKNDYVRSAVNSKICLHLSSYISHSSIIFVVFDNGISY